MQFSFIHLFWAPLQPERCVTKLILHGVVQSPATPVPNVEAEYECTTEKPYPEEKLLIYLHFNELSNELFER